MPCWGQAGYAHNGIAASIVDDQPAVDDRHQIEDLPVLAADLRGPGLVVDVVERGAREERAVDLEQIWDEIDRAGIRIEPPARPRMAGELGGHY